jgi:predicted NAD/FAD-dependent oxidoreductase
MGPGGALNLNRRQSLSWLAGGLAAGGGLAGCADDALAHIGGGFVGTDPQRPHHLWERAPPAAPQQTRRVHTVIVGAGLAGLTAARALRLRGMDDFAVLELEGQPGGNARGGTTGGLPCPLGAHYLPVPSDDAPEVQDWLEELGLRQRVAGRWVYDERHLCHSPQERLFFQGQWHDGLLPLQGVGTATRAQYTRFARLVEGMQKTYEWTIPIRNRPIAPEQQALAAITFDSFLTQQGLDDAHLRWYLDYCCRDDYGAGSASVSAWAGIHYFAARHGFAAPGEAPPEAEGLLTWPQGNAWLVQRLVQPLGSRLLTGQLVRRVAQGKHAVALDVLDLARHTSVRWQAQQVVLAVPLFVAERVLEGAPDWLHHAARAMVYAPWWVANVHLRAPLQDRPGAAPSWDNVLYGAPGLGYVDAGHQNLQAVPGATVLTYYRALGGPAAQAASARAQLLARPWATFRAEVLTELGTAHPDLIDKATHIDVARFGHAMAVPAPGASLLPDFLSKIGLQTSSLLRKTLLKREQLLIQSVPRWERLRFAHSDWAGYSVLEEAFTLGHWAGMGVS